MQKTVFILGAGASVEAGGPLMSTFLDRARDLHKAGKVADKEEHFTRVFKAINALRGVFYKSDLDLDNIESLFGAFEMARIVDKLGDYSTAEIEAVAGSMEVFIEQTLLQSIMYPCELPSLAVNPPIPYGQFAQLLRKVTTASQDNSTPRRCSILTFNYDTALDYALASARLQQDYCLQMPKNEDSIKLLKLHGSLNWYVCSSCKQIAAVCLSRGSEVCAVSDVMSRVPSELGTFVTLPRLPTWDQPLCRNCNLTLTGNPVIVPPTWNKGQRYAELTSVWKQAASELGEAENIICIGYSLPESDLFFRYLFALGTIGDTHVRRFWVFDPDPKGTVEGRYRELIGRGIEHKFRFFNGDAGKFSNAVSNDGELWKAFTQ